MGQPVIVRIGYTDIMLPDDRDVATVMRTLARGVMVRDLAYRGKIVVREESAVRVEVSTVPRNVSVVNEVDDVEEPAAGRTVDVPSRRILNGQRRLPFSNP